MNKEITIYELLGLIKDGKSPKLVRYDYRIWEYKKQFDDYFNNEEYLIGDGFDNWDNSKDYLNEKVKIIEEYKPIIEKLKIEEDIVCNKFIKNEYGTKCYIKTHDKIIIDRLNEVIDYINNHKQNVSNSKLESRNK